MAVVVWAFRPLRELDRRTGFVECDDELAARLIEDGRVQDLAVGHENFRHITIDAEDDGQTYETRELTAKPKRKK